MTTLLVVDDERNIRVRLAGFFESCGYSVQTAETGQQALELFERHGPFDLVLTDYRMAELNGLELLQQIKRQAPEIPVILMTAYGTVENAVAAMKAGAYDYLAKPFSLEQIQHVVERALEMQKLRTENRVLRDTLEERPLLESRSGAMRRLLDTARQAARSEATILLTGESGTGKNVLA
ncbi:MAG TPA: response regulator, partial [Candidatus Binataceae bacterium]|nr:response regulator [Candidatus Binataceae bacterium]